MRTQAYNNAIHQGGLCEFAPEFHALRCMDGELYAKFKVSSLELDLCFFNLLNEGAFQTL